jgi:hypothetical protein
MHQTATIPARRFPPPGALQESKIYHRQTQKYP